MLHWSSFGGRLTALAGLGLRCRRGFGLDLSLLLLVLVDECCVIVFDVGLLLVVSFGGFGFFVLGLVCAAGGC